MTLSNDAHTALQNLPHPPSIIDEFGSPGSHIVFLLDENHEVPEVITDNIRTGRILVASDLVNVIGIEDVPAEIDEFQSSAPKPFSYSALPSLPRRPGEFESSMRSDGTVVVGIDSLGWIEKIMDDVSDGTTPEARDHPGQEERSRHFVRALMRERAVRELAGNSLISCGTDHNSHIMAMARDPNRPLWWPDWAFIRIRAGAHP